MRTSTSVFVCAYTQVCNGTENREHIMRENDAKCASYDSPQCTWIFLHPSLAAVCIITLSCFSCAWKALIFYFFQYCFLNPLFPSHFTQQLTFNFNCLSFKYEKTSKIEILDKFSLKESLLIFYSGTKLNYKCF